MRETTVYHVTQREAFSDIVKSGAIVPIAYRISPDTLYDLCVQQSVVPGLSRFLPPDLVQDLIDYYVEVGPTPSPREIDIPKVNTSCVEIILGYGQYVMLMPEPSSRMEASRLYRGNTDNFYAIGFDMETLINEGAGIVRRHSFIEELYSQWMFEFRQGEEATTRPERLKMLLDASAAAHQATEVYGDNALKIAKRISPSYYVLYPGELDISKATHYIVAGEKVTSL